MPGANSRAMEKARSLACDAIIFDLEDAVSPDAKATAREQVRACVAQGGFGSRKLIIRVNGLDTPWGEADVEALAGTSVAALLFPKVESAGQVCGLLDVVDRYGGQDKEIWLMIETPKGVLDLREFAALSPRIKVLVMGTSDLVKELRARHTPDRSNLAFLLQYCVTVARALGLTILDGVHLDFRNLESLGEACERARDMGFDGKTLIHPTQIDVANQAFGFDEQAIAHARAVLAAWAQAQAEGKGVAVLEGQLIENLHAQEAERVLSFAQAIAER